MLLLLYRYDKPVNCSCRRLSHLIAGLACVEQYDSTIYVSPADYSGKDIDPILWHKSID